MRLVILGATGSIGQSALKVWEENRERVAIEGLAAQRSGEPLWEMGLKTGAQWIALTDTEAGQRLARSHRGQPGPDIVVGRSGLLAQLADARATHVLGAMSGFAGLEPTLAALDRGWTVLLANKETLVAAGDLVQRHARQSGALLIPVDSEHSAIFQCLSPGQRFRRIILTCSGGPFRGRTRRELSQVSVAEALHHPNWSMGRKITIDSATLMNKGLEVIEAHYLFNAAYDAIDVVIHPQSVIHSLVEFEDGATLAQCGVPDMRVPISVALSWPERWPLDVPTVSWPGMSLTFEEPDSQTFPLLDLARRAGKAGGRVPAVLNAANEVAVQSFLDGQIRFLEIANIVEETLGQFRDQGPVLELADVMDADQWARDMAQRLVARAPL